MYVANLLLCTSLLGTFWDLSLVINLEEKRGGGGESALSYVAAPAGETIAVSLGRVGLIPSGVEMLIPVWVGWLLLLDTQDYG